MPPNATAIPSDWNVDGRKTNFLDKEVGGAKDR